MVLDQTKNGQLTQFNREELLADYRLAYRSRQASLIGRREVLSGKAKFGIFGDGKEIAQIAMAKVFQKGDFRSGYYRDQTFMLALGEVTIQQFFAQLYAHADIEADPHSSGRSMNAHFGTHSLDEKGHWRPLTEQYNTASDISPTGSQMPRLVGLAYASKMYRHIPELHEATQFSKGGNELAFGTIGNASCAEGMFWEAINAAGVLQIPMLLSIWDDGYGISVPNEYQITKQDLSTLLQGFQREGVGESGYELYTVNGWDYPALVTVYEEAARISREQHVPTVIHVIEMTQPQGHSTSGSHERYKSAERLEWEVEFDCIVRMRRWLLAENHVTEAELEGIEAEELEFVLAEKDKAWAAFLAPFDEERNELSDILEELKGHTAVSQELSHLQNQLLKKKVAHRRDIHITAHQALTVLRHEQHPTKQLLMNWQKEYYQAGFGRYGSHLYSESEQSGLNVREIKAIYSENSPIVNGFQVMNACFDAALARDPRIIAFGEDVGHIGDVNQGLAGMQAKYGIHRVTDTGIRETTIMGQAIGMGMRGLRPIAEIQYLDYLLYGLQILSDDLATLHWRTNGRQKAPVIVRTRGHRLEGIWHSGSLMAGCMNLLHGMHILVPRNMVQAAGFYNTLLKGDEPALVVEVLNGYRLKERLPDNIGEFTVPLGVPEIIREGEDVTVVTYGACCRVAEAAANRLAEVGIGIEIVDIQSLLPFDIHHIIVRSLQKTGRIIFFDEDVPGGTSAYMMQQVLEKQGGYYWLDSEPRTLAAQAHRPSYGSDGDYWSKPNVEDLFNIVYELMNEADPASFPPIFN